MLWLYVLLGVACQGAVLKNPERDIPAPIITRLVSLHPPGIRVEWIPVETSDPSEPVMGYKVNIWEQYRKKVLSFEMVDGAPALAEEFVWEELPSDPVSYADPTSLIVPGAASSMVLYENLKVDVLYHVRVQAFTSKGDGPLSRPVTIKLTPKQD